MSERSRRRAWRNLSLPRRILRVVLCVLLVLVLVVAAYVAYVFLDYHRIPDNTQLEVRNLTEGLEPAQVGEEYRAVTYNVGFGPTLRSSPSSWTGASPPGPRVRRA